MELIQDRYQVETLLGRGGIGDTFRVIDQKTGQKVALKQVSLTETTWKSIELFEREAEVLQQIDHPGIPKYIDAFYVDEVANRTYYIVQTLAVSGPCIESEKFWSLSLYPLHVKEFKGRYKCSTFRHLYSVKG